MFFCPSAVACLVVINGSGGGGGGGGGGIINKSLFSLNPLMSGRPRNRLVGMNL